MDSTIKEVYGHCKQGADFSYTGKWSYHPLLLSLGIRLGAPWLVNALAREVLDEMRIRPPTPITPEHLERAKEHLILARATHLDSLASKLHEPRVRRVIAPMMAGEYADTADSYDDDVQYVADLGLITRKPVAVANPIYREVMLRVLAAMAEDSLPVPPSRTFILPDGRLDISRVLHEFADFWREHGDILANGLSYHEVAPQLVILAWLQRVVNGGGYVYREYGIGRGRIDVLVRWPYEEDGQRRWQQEALELKVWAPGRPDPLSGGLAQIDGYLQRLGLDHGVLVIFDRRPEAADIAARTVFSKAETPTGRQVVLLRG